MSINQKSTMQHALEDMEARNSAFAELTDLCLGIKRRQVGTAESLDRALKRLEDEFRKNEAVLREAV